MAERDAGYGVQVDWRYMPVAVVRMRMGKNAINADFVREMNAALDTVVARPDVRALVTTGDGKFYCNGIDLDFMNTLAQQHPGAVAEFADKQWRTLQWRILFFPMPTIAAINGHAFGGGAVFTLHHDLRVMSTKRGWWNTNEVHLGIRFPTKTLQLARMKLSEETFHEAVVMGRRYTGETAVSSRIVQRTCKEPGDVVQEAVDLALSLVQSRGYDRETIAGVKENAYEAVRKTPDRTDTNANRFSSSKTSNL